MHFADINLDAEPDGADWPTLHFRLKEAAYTFYPICRRIIGFHDMRLSVNAEARSFVGNFQASQCTTDLRLQDAVS